MSNDLKFYIDGQWVDPSAGNTFDVIDPAREKVISTISLGSAEDIDRAVAAARRAFFSYSQTSPRERIDILERIIAKYEQRKEDLANAMSREMGSPITFAREVQSQNALAHLREIASVLKTYEFEHSMGGTLIRREAIGVCGLITPWNWPMNQVTSKVGPALGAGCTIVLKPSEFSPLSTLILAEIMHDAKVPPGVFNLVNGEGGVVGDAISRHPDIDMVSFTGSTRAGIMVAKAAADTVKRVTQELGGKSANIILRDADLRSAVIAGVNRCFANSGQSCQAPTRMLIHRSQRDEAVEYAKSAVKQVKIGDPLDSATTMGPVVNKQQFGKIQSLIDQGIKENATLVTGGLGRPSELNGGYFVRPTVFADVTPDMKIAQEEIFGPVLCMMNYTSEEQAVEIANATPYGLAAYIYGGDIETTRRLAELMRAGRVYLNGAPADRSVPFGGYKMSGNGREQGVFGLEEYLEVKAVLGHHAI